MSLNESSPGGGNQPESTSGDGHETAELDTRQRLVRAAVEVFLEKGYGGTRVQDIAERAGYTSGALYVHFPSRTALLGEAIIQEGRAIMEDLALRIAHNPNGVEATADLLVAMSSGPPSRLDLLLLEAVALASRADDAKRVLEATLEQLLDITMTRIQSSADRGVLVEGFDPLAIRQVFIAWIFGGIVVKSLGLGHHDEQAVRAVTLRAVGAFVVPS